MAYGGPEGRELRERTASEMADVAVWSCRQSFPVLAAASLAFTLPGSVALWGAVAVGGLRPVVVGGAVFGVGVALAHAACVEVTGDQWLRGDAVARDAVWRTLRRAPAVVLLWVVGLLKVALGLVLLVVPGILAALSLAPALPVLVLERASPLQSVRRAAQLSRDRRGAHLVSLGLLSTLTLAVLLVLVQPVAIGALVSGGRDAPVLVGLAAAQLAACVLIVPLFAALSTAAYVDARVRKEGLDLLFLLDADETVTLVAA